MKFTLGVDEAGRGPLAGPVSVGVVMVPEGFDVAKEFPGVQDSKKLTEGKREKLYEMLVARVARGDAHFAVEFESAATIDTEGIVPSVQKALNRGIEKCGSLVARSQTSENFLKSSFDFHIFLDGSLHAPEEYAQETIIHGDALIPIISLASIAAKVERDHLMVALAKEYPEYGFETHKGYGTKMHYEKLLKYGLCAIHRRSFIHLAFEAE